MGRDMEPANRELSDWIAEAGLVDRFVLLGERRDALDCIAAMDVYCLSSRSEGFPMFWVKPWESASLAS